MLKRIDNLDILCDDVDAMARFYNEALGLPFALPFEPGAGWAMMDAGNLRIYLAQATPGQHSPRRTAVNEENPAGFDSIAFEVDDLDEAIETLTAKNVEWVVADIIRWDHNDGTWYRYRPFYDPEGNMVYVTEPHLAASTAAASSSTVGDA